MPVLEWNYTNQNMLIRYILQGDVILKPPLADMNKNAWDVLIWHDFIGMLTFFRGGGGGWGTLCFNLFRYANTSHLLRRKKIRPKFKRSSPSWLIVAWQVGMGIFSFKPPGRLTWNIKFTLLERKIIFQTIILRFYINLRGCNQQSLDFQNAHLVSRVAETHTISDASVFLYWLQYHYTISPLLLNVGIISNFSHIHYIWYMV